jgi:hypothetical protein
MKGAVLLERSITARLAQGQEHSAGELEEAVASVKADVAEIKERTHR